MLFLPNGPIKYLYEMVSHHVSGGTHFFISFETFVPCGGHTHNLSLILSHDCGTTEHHLSPIAIENIYRNKTMYNYNYKKLSYKK